MAFFEHEFFVTIRDIDTKTNLTNKAILSFFEDIGGYQSNLAGYGLKQIEETKISWVLLNWKVKIIKQIKYDGNPIKIKTWSRGVKRASCFRDYELYNSNGELYAIGTSKWAVVHLENGLMRVTDEIISKYIHDDKCVFGEDFDFVKLKECDNYSNVYEYTVSRKDIDINNHMHNLNYLDLAYEALPKDIYESTTFNDFEIMYKTGAFLGDNVKCFYSKVENEHFVTIKSEDEKTLHAIIKLF